jgi:hypothetical protein
MSMRNSPSAKRARCSQTSRRASSHASGQRIFFVFAKLSLPCLPLAGHNQGCGPPAIGPGPTKTCGIPHHVSTVGPNCESPIADDCTADPDQPGPATAKTATTKYTKYTKTRRRQAMDTPAFLLPPGGALRSVRSCILFRVLTCHPLFMPRFGHLVVLRSHFVFF